MKSPTPRWLRILGRIVAAIVIVAGIATVVFMLGPRPPIDETIRFSAVSIGDDPVRYLADEEARVTGTIPGAEKEIIWLDPATRARTPLAIVYIHGFSATKWEVRPLAEEVAAVFGANLYYTRLAGHGNEDGAAMAAATMNEWVNDMAEAIAIGERLGERIVVISTSTGGTLSTWAAGNPALSGKLAGLVMISPNFEPREVSVELMNMPWGKYLLPLAFGETRSWTPVNAEQGKWWTTTYPSIAVLPMAALLQAVKNMDVSKIKVPAFFIYSPRDNVVSPDATLKVYEAWGGPKQIFEELNSSDLSHHVLAGDILNPGNTDDLAARIVTWIRGLGLN